MCISPLKSTTGFGGGNPHADLLVATTIRAEVVGEAEQAAARPNLGVIATRSTTSEGARATQPASVIARSPTGPRAA